MHRFILAFVLLIALSLSAFSQGSSGMSDTDKMMMYESGKKNPTTAVVLSCLLTSSGHAYAGNWGRGLAFTAGRIGCGVIAITMGIKEETETYDGGWYTIEETTTEITGMYYVGMLGATAIAIWEMIDASNQVKKYNQNLFEKVYGKKPQMGFNIIPDKNGGKLALTYNF